MKKIIFSSILMILVLNMFTLTFSISNVTAADSDEFWATAYYCVYASEMEGTQTVTQIISGITYTLKASFLFGGHGVAMQGTGRTGSGGDYIHYVGSGGTFVSVDNPFEDAEVRARYAALGITDFTGFGNIGLQYPGGAAFSVVSGVIGASLRTLVPWYSIAVDPAVISLGTTGTLLFKSGTTPGDATEMSFRADDTGGAIAGNHIDIYVGEGISAINEWIQTGGNRYVEVKPAHIWNTGGDFELGTFDSGDQYGVSQPSNGYWDAPWGSEYWGVHGYSWENENIYPIHQCRFSSNGHTAYMHGKETEGKYGTITYIQGDIWDWNGPWHNPEPLSTNQKHLTLNIDLYRELTIAENMPDSRIMFAINVWFNSPEISKRLVMDLIFYLGGNDQAYRHFEDEYAFHYQYLIGTTPSLEWKKWNIDLSMHIQQALSNDWKLWDGSDGSGPIDHAEDTLKLYQLEFLLEIVHAEAAVEIDNFYLVNGQAEITFINSGSNLLVSPNHYACQPEEDVLIRLGAKNTGSASLNLRVALKIYNFRGYGSLGGDLIYDSTSSGEDQEVELDPGDLSPVIEFHWLIPSLPTVPAYGIYAALKDSYDTEIVYCSIGGPDDWANGLFLHVPYDNLQSDQGAAIIEWMGNEPSEEYSQETYGFFVALGVTTGLTAVSKLAPSIISAATAFIGGVAFDFLINYVEIANLPSLATASATNIIDGTSAKDIVVYGSGPVPLVICFTPGTNIVWPLQIRIEKETGFLQPRELISTFSISGDLWIGGVHVIYLKNLLTFSSEGTYHVVIADCTEDIAGFTPSEAVVDVEPSVREGVTSNVVPNGCVMMTFEDGNDASIISSSISGMQFTTTMGYDWVYGDKRTGSYNVHPYGSRAYACRGNVFAWLGPYMGQGRIDFPFGSASYFSVLTSTYSGLTIDAYDSDNNLIATSGWATNNLRTYKFTRLTVEAPGIAYVLIHDTGNYWLIDDLVTNAPSLTFSPMSSTLESEISQGETQGWIFDVGTESVDFTAELSWGGSNMDFFALDPTGQMYPSMLVSANKRRIVVYDAMPGYWRLIVYGEDLPSGSELYSLSVSLGADNDPPTTTLLIGTPQYSDGSNLYITSETVLTLTAEDEIDGSGTAATSYKIYNASYDTGWISSLPPMNFLITSFNDGTYYIGYNSTDNAGNVESTNTQAVVLDNTAPEMIVSDPPAGWALQDGVTFLGSITDAGCGVFSMSFSIREANDGDGIPIGFEDISASYDSSTGEWSFSFDTLLVPDGYYVLYIEAEDNLGNEASKTVPYSIRNWAVIELLPASEDNKAGRTMPVKFALVVAAEVDPAQPFVYNEELRIEIFATADPDDILQESYYGDTARDYRISSVLYITNFKTLKTPMEYTVAIYRDTFDVGSFTFETVK